MSDEQATATASTATGPAQARALRKSGLFDVDFDDQREDDDPAAAAEGTAAPSEPSTPAEARDAATAADQAARMSQIGLRADGLLERLRADDIDVAPPKADPEPEGEPEAKRRRWRK